MNEPTPIFTAAEIHASAISPNLTDMRAEHGEPNRSHYGRKRTVHTWHLTDRDVKLVLYRKSMVVEVPHETGIDNDD